MVLCHGMSNKTEHLWMIQDVISRMAGNSLQIKCWCMAIVAVIIAFTDGRLMLAGIVPIALFCWMDAKYLSLEKAYRNLYDMVRQKDESEIDFSMETEKEEDSKGFKSWSVSWFYLVLAATVILIAVYRMW